MAAPSVPLPHQCFTLVMDDGAGIEVRQYGKARGQRLVLSHGNGFAIDAYYPFWRHFLERFEVVIFDLRNHGHNALHAPDTHDVPRFMRDYDIIIDGITNHLGERRTAALFHSISSITAIKHAVEVGWRWDALVAFDPPLIPSPGHPLHTYARNFELNLSRWALSRPNRFGTPEEMADGFRTSKSRRFWLDEAHERMAWSVLREESAGGDWVLRCPRECESRVYATNAALDLCPRLVDIPGPVKFICADHDILDAWSPAHVNLQMHREYRLPYAMVRDTTHMLELEKPRECAAEVLSFIEECGFRD